MFGEVKDKMLWIVGLGVGGTLILLYGIGLIVEGKSVLGGVLLVPAGVLMAIAFMMLMQVVFRAVLSPEKGDLALGILALIGGGVQLNWNMDVLRNLSEHILHAGDLPQMRADEALFGFSAYFFLLVAVLGVVLLVQRQKRKSARESGR